MQLLDLFSMPADVSQEATGLWGEELKGWHEVGTVELILTEMNQCIILCVFPQMCCCRATLTLIWTSHLRLGGGGGNLPSQQTAGCGNKVQSAGVPGNASLRGCLRIYVSKTRPRLHRRSVFAFRPCFTFRTRHSRRPLLLSPRVDKEIWERICGLRGLGLLYLIRPTPQAPRILEAFAFLCLHDKGLFRHELSVTNHC